MILFNDGWEFTKQPLFTDYDEIKKKQDAFYEIGLPHDWLIDGNDLYEDSTGWYRKYFHWEKKEGKRVFIRFDGVYMDSTIYLNGKKVGEWKYGYSTFEVELSDGIQTGNNELLVSVNHQSPNSRWYSGAGIYRDVWIKEVYQDAIVSDGIYVSTKKIGDWWDIEVETECVGSDIQLEYELRKKGEVCWENLEGKTKREESIYFFSTKINQPHIWDIESPTCYELRVTLKKEGMILQQETQTIGFREVKFSSEKGCLLNGRKVKLNGVCEHHDLGCLGAAYHTKAMRRKLNLLKEMGVNAIRTSHNMPASDVMDLADELGLLVVSEAFDMWELSKTPYDYSRFFSQWYKKDVASWVRRDRNHPSLIMWSIGNEIYDTHASERGQYITKLLMKEVERYDRKKNGRVTIGSNYMPWENAQRCADIVKLVGYNYGDSYYNEHHKKYKDWIIYGSETASTVQSRGIYHFPLKQSVLADEDEQCSSLGNSTTSWGAKNSEACIIAERDHEFSCGQFLWTGFDYIGEPTPYHTRNSYFGQIDTAGFPKDSFYIYQAEWTDYKKKPMVHLFPYWDFNLGQNIDVRVCSNAPVVELFVNKKSMGTYVIDHKKGKQLVANWNVPYKEGEICAVAYDENGVAIAEEKRHSFSEAYEICFQTKDYQLVADGEDLLFGEIYMKDRNGYIVENATNRVNILVEGAGELVGTDNGDSTDSDSYKDNSRRLFSGKLLLVCKAKTNAGTMKIKITSYGLKELEVEIPVVTGEKRKGSSSIAYVSKRESKEDDNVPVRNIYLSSSKGVNLTKELRETVVTAIICPESATDKELLWSIVDDAGIEVRIAEVIGSGNQICVRAKSDGDFRLRCMSKSGTNKIRIISQLEFHITGLGKAYTNPYEFVVGGTYTYSKGKVGNGNEKGFATATDGECQVGFTNIDFGKIGSEEITMPIFALNDEPYEIKIYEGISKESGELIGDVIYQKPSIWNVYQEETFHLKKRLKGLTSICFVTNKKIHVKGFVFKEYNNCWDKTFAVDCSKIYGDSFKREDGAIKQIGNNVTIQFPLFDFKEKSATSITICGETPLKKNTIILCLNDNNGETRQVLEFMGGNQVQTFSIDSIRSKKQISFLFLPGSNFDFQWFQFHREL